MWVRRLGRSGPDIGVTALYMPLPDADRLEDRVLPHQGTVRKAGSGNLWACGRGKAVSGNLAELVGIDVPTGLLIGGKWTGGRDGGTIPVIDPATEDAVAEVADGTEQDALDAVGAAHDALAGWAATPARQRAECLRRTFELMTRDADALARLMVAENGWQDFAVSTADNRQPGRNEFQRVRYEISQMGSGGCLPAVFVRLGTAGGPSESGSTGRPARQNVAPARARHPLPAAIPHRTRCPDAPRTGAARHACAAIRAGCGAHGSLPDDARSGRVGGAFGYPTGCVLQDQPSAGPPGFGCAADRKSTR